MQHLSERAQEQVRRVLANAPKSVLDKAGKLWEDKKRQLSRKRQPNKTEMTAWRLLEHSGKYSRIVWEGITLRLRNGHKYTPDLVCIPRLYPVERVMLVEVKGSYHHGSLQRSKLAYDQAVIDWPEFEFCWMTKRKDGTWEISRND